MKAAGLTDAPALYPLLVALALVVMGAWQPFDPSLHEAITTIPATSPEDDGLIVGTVRPGYRIGEDVLRPAAVAVAKA